MSEAKIKELFDSMLGARFDEFTIRAASFGLRFSKYSGSDEIVFNVETQSDVKDFYDPLKNYEPAIEQVSGHLFSCLEKNVYSIIKVDAKAYEICFDSGVKIYLVNEFNDQFSEIFSVNTKNWPKGAAVSHFNI